MAEPFLAEIRIVGFNFAPRGWALCDGQILPINQNQNLYSLLGTTYGGDGRTSFALPDLRGRTPIHFGQDDGRPNYLLGQKGGFETVTLTQAEMAAHTHTAKASSAQGDAPVPAGNILADTPQQIYAAPAALVSIQPATIANVGGGQAHNDMQPVLVLNFCIALQGLFPSRN